MIAIVNVTKGGMKDGINDYELRINHRVICTFQHVRESGLSQCLIDAAKAFDDQRLKQIEQVQQFIRDMDNDH